MSAVAWPVERLRAREVRISRVAIGLAGLLVGSFFLRTTALHAHFWIDEGLSVGIASHHLSAIPGILREDGSPPLYYLLLHVWMSIIGGDGEARTHALSLAFSLICIPAAFGAAWRLFGTRAAWIAGVLAALSPFLTWYAQETRMYSLVALLSLCAGATFALVFALGRRQWLPAFSVSLALLLYAHNWGLFLCAGTLAAFALILLDARERRPLLRDGLIGYGAALVLYAPWLPSLLFQSEHTGAPWANAPNLWHDTLHALSNVLAGTVPAMAILLTAGSGLIALLSMRGTAIEGRARFQDRPPQARAALALGVMIVTGIFFAWVASQITPAWANRYFASFVGPLLLLISVGLTYARRFGLVGLAIVAVYWLNPHTGQINAKSDAHNVAILVRDTLKPGDLVVSTHPEQTPLMYYYLPPGLRYATSMGPVSDPRVMNWVDALDRLKAAGPKRTERKLLKTMRPGQRLLLVQPILRTARWGAPWTKLVKRRSVQWEHALDGDPRLERTLTAPVFGYGPLPHGVRAIVYTMRY
ncbi:MAG TPA: glycosyltransferase family 39 protein [Solirubrobacteraceae bacterium]|nr:glycosyltransferase family 39 protein [Solirubrobacteraceae bacterium]